MRVRASVSAAREPRPIVVPSCGNRQPFRSSRCGARVLCVEHRVHQRLDDFGAVRFVRIVEDRIGRRGLMPRRSTPPSRSAVRASAGERRGRAVETLVGLTCSSTRRNACCRSVSPDSLHVRHAAAAARCRGRGRSWSSVRRLHVSVRFGVEGRHQHVEEHAVAFEPEPARARVVAGHQRVGRISRRQHRLQPIACNRDPVFDGALEHALHLRRSDNAIPDVGSGIGDLRDDHNRRGRDSSNDVSTRTASRISPYCLCVHSRSSRLHPTDDSSPLDAERCSATPAKHAIDA